MEMDETKLIPGSKKWIEEVVMKISQSIFADQNITIGVFNERGANDFITGKIDKIDQRLGRIKIVNDSEYAWIPFGDIITINL